MNEINEVKPKGIPLKEEEINNLVIENEKIVRYLSNKYRFFDKEIEEVKAWGYLGLAKAINLFIEKHSEGENIKLSTIAFSKVKAEIVRHYNQRPKSEMSIHQEVLGNADGATTTLEETLADENQLLFNGFDVGQLIEEALFEESELARKVNHDWLMKDKTIEDIAHEYRMSESSVKRLYRKGQTLMKLYLVNNDVISDFIIRPVEKKEKTRGVKEFQIDDYGKLKYIKKYYSYLSTNDIAKLLNVSSLSIHTFLDYPSTDYITTEVDDTIKEKVIDYCKNKYPERLPGEVIIYKDVNKIMA